MLNLIKLFEGSVCWFVIVLLSVVQDVYYVQIQFSCGCVGDCNVSGLICWECCYVDVSVWIEWDWVEMGEGIVVQVDLFNV